MSTARIFSLSPESAARRVTQLSEHVVQFYRDDQAMLRQLESYVWQGLSRGSSAVVIATAGRRDNLALALQSRGINLTQVTAEGRYTALDASEVLRILIVDGRPHPLRFTQVVAPVIGRATAASLAETDRVVAFGEMVGLLWAEGKPEAAIQLEQLWNDLGRKYTFSLRCGYPMPGFCGNELAESLLQICAEHTSVERLESFAEPVPESDRIRSVRALRPGQVAVQTGCGGAHTNEECRGLPKLVNPHDVDRHAFPEKIQAERLLLRAYQEDTVGILELLEPNREQLIREFPQMAWLRTPEEVRDFVQQKTEQWHSGNNFCYGIWRTEDGKQVGQIQVKNISWDIPSAELGYFIGAAWQRRGFAMESIRAILSVAFQELGFQRIYVRILVSNAESFALANKLGFRQEGLHRKAFRCGFGQLHDVYYMAVTADDYRTQMSGISS
jgi:RimJ/RimL family protein N-acetyltransferase